MTSFLSVSVGVSGADGRRQARGVGRLPIGQSKTQGARDSAWSTFHAVIPRSPRDAHVTVPHVTLERLSVARLGRAIAA